MEIKQLTYFPNDINRYICSYLYFSDYLSQKVYRINQRILNYNIEFIKYLKAVHKYNTIAILHQILSYFLYDKIKCDTLLLDFDILDNSYTNQAKELLRIIVRLRSIDILRIRNYIFRRGRASEYFSY